MRIILSPAKKMNEDQDICKVRTNESVFPVDTGNSIL